MVFGKKLKSLRTSAGLTPLELAARSNLSRLSIYAYERGAVDPSLSAVQRMTRALGVSMAEFDECVARETSNKGKAGNMRKPAKEA